MKEVLDLIQKMRIDCGWDKTDTLPILIKSVSIEASELLETIQWDDDTFKEEKVKSELADVLMYALSIAIDNNWDVEELLKEKIENVYKRYLKNND
ncbi:MAG: nucleotide pyrophosphohydrolase [Erysipelotrichia bacterium]|nr:nucleotide pyrophosphohydrolase [Erysipelotrichia bacterium]